VLVSMEYIPNKIWNTSTVLMGALTWLKQSKKRDEIHALIYQRDQ